MILKTFGKNILWNDQSKVKLFERHVSGYTCSKPITAFHVKNVIPTVKHGGGSVMVWAALLLQDLNDSPSLMEPDNPPGECFPISLWPKAEEQLAYESGQRSKAHKQVHIGSK